MRSLKSFLLFLLLAASGCSESRPEVDREAQTASIKLIEEHHGFHSEYGTRPFTLDTVSLDSPDVTDEVVQKILGGAPQLRILKLRYTAVSDALLGQLEKLTPRLEILEISGSPQVTDVGVRFLEGLPKLQQLSLTDTGATATVGEQLQKKRSQLKRALIKNNPAATGAANSQAN